MPDSAETTAIAPDRPRARERGRMRRRLRTQKRMREALLMDLGALVYELHRQSRRAPELLQAKAAELASVDQEVRGLAEALKADAGTLAMVAAGVAGTCETCGSLLSTDDRYCAACGNPAVPALAGSGPAAGPLLTEAADPPSEAEPEAPAHGPDDEEVVDDEAEEEAWADEPAPWLADGVTHAGPDGRSTRDG